VVIWEKMISQEEDSVVEYVDDDRVFGLDADLKEETSWQPAPPSEASASVVLPAAVQTRKGKGSKAGWRPVRAPELDASGRKKAIWEDVGKTKVLPGSKQLKGSVLIAGVDCTSLVKRLQNCWVRAERPLKSSMAGVSALKKKSRNSSLICFADMTLENPEDFILSLLQGQGSYSRWERVWKEADPQDKLEAHKRVEALTLAVKRALTAEAAFEKIERAEQTITDALQQAGILSSSNSSGVKDSAASKAAVKLQSTWRGCLSRYRFKRFESEILTQLEIDLARNREAFRNRDHDSLRRSARQRAAEKLKTLSNTNQGSWMGGFRANDRRQINSSALKIRLEPGLEVARLASLPIMGVLQQELGESFELYVNQLWEALSIVRAEISPTKTVLDFEHALRDKDSFGDDDRVSIDDIADCIQKGCPSLNEHQVKMLSTFFNSNMDGLAEVERVGDLVRGALSDRRHLLCNFVFDRNYFSKSKASSSSRNRLRLLEEFYAQFAPAEFEAGKAKQVHLKYTDNEQANRELFKKLYKKYAPWLEAPDILWNRTKQAKEIEKACVIEPETLLGTYQQHSVSQRAFLTTSARNSLDQTVDALKSFIESHSLHGERLGFGRTDWLAFHAEMSAGIESNEAFEQIVCAANGITTQEWQEFAEKNARRNLKSENKLALSRCFEEAENLRMQKIKENLCGEAFENYQHELADALRKVRGALLCVCGTNRSLEDFEQEFKRSESFGDDYKLSSRDFRASLTRYGIVLNRQEVQILSQHFDEGNTGHVNVGAFFHRVRASQKLRIARTRHASEALSLAECAKRQRKWVKALRTTVVEETEKVWERHVVVDAATSSERPFWFCKITGERIWKKPRSFERQDRVEWEREARKRASSALRTLESFHEKANAELDMQLDVVKRMAKTAMPLECAGLYQLPTTIFDGPSMRTLKFLTLDDNKFEKIPAAVMQLTELEFLSLCGNQIMSLISDDLLETNSCFSSLLTLKLSRNKLKVIPATIGRLQSLKNLYLDQNCISTIPNGTFAGLQLNLLDLSSNRINVLPSGTPDWLSLAASLHHLNLQNNQLVDLPKPIGEMLTNLTFLDISDNRLAKLAGKFGSGLQKLEELRLHGNNLMSLPGSIGEARSLLEIHLQHNALTSFPAEICALNGLNYLRANNNRIGSLPDRIGVLSSLKTLELQCNRLVSLPASFSCFTSLEQCSLHQNDIQQLPQVLPGSLTHLKLQNNRLKSLPANFGDIGESLSHLDLAGNEINRLPPSFAKLQALNFLRIDNNPLCKDLSEIARSGQFTTHDEENFGFLLRKLQDGLRSNDLENRVDTALGVTVEQAMRQSLYALQEKLQRAKEVAHGVNETARMPSCDKLDTVNQRRGRTTVQQNLHRCLKRFSKNHGGDGKRISKKAFISCVQVIGHLLTHLEVQRIAERVFETHHDSNSGEIEISTFVDSLQHVSRATSPKEDCNVSDLRTTRHQNVARAVVRYFIAQQAKTTLLAMKKLTQIQDADMNLAKKQMQDLKSLTERDEELTREIDSLRQELGVTSHKAHVVQENERIETHLRTVRGQPVTPKKSTRPRTPKAKKDDFQTERQNLQERLRQKNREVQELKRKILQTQAVARYFNSDIEEEHRKLMAMEAERKRKIGEAANKKAPAHQRARMQLERDKREHLRGIFRKHATERVVNGSGRRKLVLSKGEMIAAAGEFFRQFHSGRATMIDSKEWREKLLFTVNEAFHSGIRDSKTRKFVPFDRDGNGVIEWSEFKLLSAELDARLDVIVEEEEKKQDE